MSQTIMSNPEMGVPDTQAIPMPTADGRRPHVPALDGIRGIAILLVVLSHTSQDTRPPANCSYLLSLYRDATLAGWSGVILFFVLSGYLITGILFDSRRENRFFYNFYGRRTVRIFPLYYAFLIGMTFVIPWLQRHFPAGSLGDNRPGIWHWFYLSNFEVAVHGAWRHGVSEIAWSLAIEEQFYIVWPFLVRLLSRRQMIGVCIAMIVLATGLRAALVFAGTSPVSIYTLTPTRIDALLIGACLALILRGPTPLRLVRLAAISALITGAIASIGVYILTHDSGPYAPLMQTVGYTAFAGVFAGILSLAVIPTARSAINTFFANRVLIFFGRYSYAIYLTHIPILILMRDRIFRHSFDNPVANSPFLILVGFQVILFLVMGAVGWVSWHVFERYFLALKRYFAASPRDGVPLSQL